MTREELTQIFGKWCKKLRLTPGWDLSLQFVEDPGWRKTGDFKIDCTERPSSC